MYVLTFASNLVSRFPRFQPVTPLQIRVLPLETHLPSPTSTFPDFFFHASNFFMASSSTGSTGSMTSGFQNVNVNFRNRNNPVVLCRCGVEASFSISWTDKNSGRKFRGCTNYKDPSKYCKFFMWLDPPLPSEDYKNLMYQMHLALVGMVDGNAQLEQVNVDQNRRLMLMMKLIFIMGMLFAVMLVTWTVLLVRL
ncbi:unnamed protein product [Lactuca saligna]|uniref:GRF-type domain-containing protein n=1 Tax=Lactuca saligna TaxID=75948 RepID=A0AA35VRW3_LACSI|nr:unnamed protein product [Lactuca saligna]